MSLNEPGRDPQVIEEFRRRRVRQLVAVVPFVAALIPLLMLEDAGPEGLFGIPAVAVAAVCGAVLIAGLIFSLVNWRCPACKGYLGKAISPRFCQKCGARLQA
jgi:hypothetical protein